MTVGIERQIRRPVPAADRLRADLIPAERSAGISRYGHDGDRLLLAAQNFRELRTGRRELDLLRPSRIGRKAVHDIRDLIDLVDAVELEASRRSRRVARCGPGRRRHARRPWKSASDRPPPSRLPKSPRRWPSRPPRRATTSSILSSSPWTRPPHADCSGHGHRGRGSPLVPPLPFGLTGSRASGPQASRHRSSRCGKRSWRSPPPPLSPGRHCFRTR